MELLLTGGTVFSGGVFRKADVAVRGKSISVFENSGAASDIDTGIDISDMTVFPGFADVHTHLREPGFSYKETVTSATDAAAHGGYTAVCAMPNLSPAPDCAGTLAPELRLIEAGARVKVLPLGTITRGRAGAECADFESMAQLVCGFSDDGSGVADAAVMREAMQRCKKLGKPIVSHCEDGAGSETGQLARDLELVALTGCRYHVCHVSKAESVALIRAAKAAGLPVTAETAPHYLTLTAEDVDGSGRFKMNPPLGSEADRRALIEAAADGTVDCVATDHAPHSAEEKSRGFAHSASGIVGLETAFPVLYTELVLKGLLSLERLTELLAVRPREIFGIEPDGLAVFDLRSEYTIDPARFLTLARTNSTPWEGKTVRGENKLTICGGEIVWRKL